MLSKYYFCEMIQIDDKIITLDIFKKYFLCDLNVCKGACCIEGDSGAPLEKEEEKKLQNSYKNVISYMTKNGIAEIKKRGVAVYDSEGDLTTPLVNNRECAFVSYENGITKCAIEKAYNDGKIDFKKPISCHLFPIRIKEYPDFEALSYEKIKICKPACDCGSKFKVPLYIFLKDPLIRKYGVSWYNELLEAAKIIDQ